MSSKSYFYARELIIALTGVLGSLIPIIIILYCSYQTINPAVDLNQIYSYFLGFCIRNIAPKPGENFVFLTTAILTPMLCYLWVKMSLLITRYYSQNQYLNILIQVIVVFFALALIIFSASSGYMANLTLGIYQYPLSLLVLWGLTFSLGYYYIISDIKHRNMSNLVLYSGVFFIFFCVVLVSLSFRVSNIYIVSDSPSWVTNFGAVFYSVTQVAAGKSLLVDLPAQYGMYGEILYLLLFKYIGLSVFKFTAVMELLQAVALLAIFFTLYKLMHHKSLVFLWMLALCFTTGFTWLFLQTGSPEPYYQYYPTRFFFPALSIALLYLFIKNKNLVLITLLAVISGLAIIWNVESELPFSVLL